MTIVHAPKAQKAPPTCGYLGCPVPDPQPPYRGLKDGIPSVTTIAKMFDLDKSAAMAYRAAQITAAMAVHQTERWWNIGSAACEDNKEKRCQACQTLAREHSTQWRRKANFGNHVHHLALSWTDGLTLRDVLAEPDGSEDDSDVRTVLDEPTEGCLNAIQAFWNQHHPEWELSERTVAYDIGGPLYVRGKFDVIGRIRCPVHPGETCRWLLDWKTGSFHPAEQAIQLSGYRNAHLTEWERVPGEDAKGRPKLVWQQTVIGPVPEVDHCGVVLVHDDGTYALHELPADESVFQRFLTLRADYDWLKEMDELRKGAQ